jgi:hypothetical protein
MNEFLADAVHVERSGDEETWERMWHDIKAILQKWDALDEKCALDYDDLRQLRASWRTYEY